MHCCDFARIFSGMMQKYKHSPVLFVRDDGLPMEFYIRAGTSQRLEIRALIEHGGGIVRYTQGGNIIRLVPSGTKVLRVSEDGLTISVQFIYDCVANNRLLDTSSYVVRVLSAKTSDISDEDDDFRKTKRPSAAPVIVHAKKSTSETVSSSKHNEKAQRINQKTPQRWTNGVREDAITMPYSLGKRSSSSSTDRSDESMSLLQKKSPLHDFKSPPKRTNRCNPSKSSVTSKCVQPISKPSAQLGECSTFNQRTRSDSDSDVGSAELDSFDVSLLGKSKNYMRTTRANQIDKPTACGSGTGRLSSHRPASSHEGNPNLAPLAHHDLSQPSSSNDTHVSPTQDFQGNEAEVPYRREIDLNVVEAACVLKDIENLVLFCKLCEDPEATVSKVRQVNRLKRIIYKSIAAADAALVLKKTKLSTYDKAVLLKYLLCEDNVHPRSATTLLSKFIDNNVQSNSRISKKKT